MDTGILSVLQKSEQHRLDTFATKNLTKLSKCARVIFPLHNGIHWAVAVLEVKSATIFLFDSMQDAAYFEDSMPLFSKLARTIFDKLEVKGEWQRTWHQIARPMNVIQQTNTYDCGVFTCVHTALYYTRGLQTGVLPRIVH